MKKYFWIQNKKIILLGLILTCILLYIYFKYFHKTQISRFYDTVGSKNLLHPSTTTKVSLSYDNLRLGGTPNNSTDIVAEFYYNKDIGMFNGETPKKLTPGEYPDIKAVGITPYTISSVKVPSGLQVILYEDLNFQGESVTLLENVMDLNDLDFNDKTNSVKIIALPSMIQRDTTTTPYETTTTHHNTISTNYNASPTIVAGKILQFL